MAECPGQVSKVPTRNLIARFASDVRGSTAIEFAFLAIPFFFLVFSIIGYGLYLLTGIQLDSAAEEAARAVRTGQAQKSGQTVKEFKDAVCDAGSAVLNCSKLEVFVQSGADWIDITPPSCVSQDNDGNNVATSGTQEQDEDGNDISIENQGGGAGTIFLLTLCYEFELSQMLAFLNLGSDLSNGSSIIQSATTFRIEPFQD